MKLKLYGTCPNCKSWGPLEEYKSCPDCNLKFSKKVRKEMEERAIIEEVYHFATHLLENWWRVLECFIEDHTILTDKDIAFNEALEREISKVFNINEFDADELYIRKVNNGEV